MTGLSIHVSPSLDPKEVEIAVSGEAQPIDPVAALAEGWGWGGPPQMSDAWQGHACRYANDLLTNVLQVPGGDGNEIPEVLTCWVTTDIGHYSGEWIIDGDGSGGDAHWGESSPPTFMQHPSGCRVSKIETQQVLIDHTVWDARTAERATEYSASLSQAMEISSETTWHVDHEISEAGSVGIEVGPLKSEETMAYSTSWGVGGGTSKTISVGSSAELRSTLEPGDLELACLVAKRGIVTVAVEIDVRMTNDGAMVTHLYAGGHGGRPRRGTPARVTDPDGAQHVTSWLMVPMTGILGPHPTMGEFLSPVVKGTLQNRSIGLADYDLSVKPITGVPDGQAPTADDIDRTIGGTDIVQIWPKEGCK